MVTEIEMNVCIWLCAMDLGEAPGVGGGGFEGRDAYLQCTTVKTYIYHNALFVFKFIYVRSEWHGDHDQ